MAQRHQSGHGWRPRGIFWVQLARARRSAMARWALLAMLVCVALSFAQTCLAFWGHDVAELPSAAVGWAGNSTAVGAASWSMLVFFLLFLLPCAAFSDALLTDVRCRAAGCIATRTTTARYVLATVAVAALAGFVVVLVPLLVSQLLAFAAFPATATEGFAGSFNASAAEATLSSGVGRRLFSGLWARSPYLYNLLFIGYDALWGALVSAASVAVSLYVRTSRLLVVGAPTLVYLLSSFLLPEEWALYSYLAPSDWVRGLSEAYFVAAPFVVAGAVAAAIGWALLSKKDVLL